MVLLNCAKCGHQVSTKAPKCPACGTAEYYSQSPLKPDAAPRSQRSGSPAAEQAASQVRTASVEGSKEITLTDDLAALVAVGIPLGRQMPDDPEVKAKGWGEAFAVRRAGDRFLLDREAHEVWCSALAAPTRAAFESLLVRRGHTTETIQNGLEKLRLDGLVLSLSGLCDQDWPLIEALRPVPRAFAAGYRGRDRNFGIYLPGLNGEVHVTSLGYAVWSLWDGATGLAEAAVVVSQTAGLSPRLVREQSHALLVGGMRAGLVFLDVTKSKRL